MPMSRRRGRGRAYRPLPTLLAVFLVAVLIVLAYHWREHERQRRAAERSERMVLLDAARIEPRLEGRRVLARGVLSAEGTLTDPELGARAEGLLLLREVEMWQWREIPEAEGVRYVAGWSSSLIDSRRFQRTAEYRNPERMPFSSQRLRPARIRLGAYLVPLESVDGLAQRAVPLRFNPDWLPNNLAASFVVRNGELHTAADPRNPKIGDLRIRYRLLEPMAAQTEAIPRGGRLELKGPLRPLP